MSSPSTSGGRDKPKRCEELSKPKPTGPFSDAIAAALAGEKIGNDADGDLLRQIMLRYSEDPSLARVAQQVRLAMTRTGGTIVEMPGEVLPPLF